MRCDSRKRYLDNKNRILSEGDVVYISYGNNRFLLGIIRDGVFWGKSRNTRIKDLQGIKILEEASPELINRIENELDVVVNGEPK